MKFLKYLILSLTLIACQRKDHGIPADSLYQVSSKWETQNGEKIRLADFRGKVLVVSMIYTSCTTACPRLTAEMKALWQKVGVKDPERLQFVLISIDPKNDAPEAMQKHLETYGLAGSNWTFLRGSEADTRELANIMAVKYKEISPMEFSHSNIITVYAKDGRLAYQQEGLDKDSEEKLVKEIKNQLKTR
ncbi:SCO family protein [Cruoricaptor ignavus]|uniref:SCO family protein n=1 Tax=Cruoricaptor ignavus TaxID=1118202 RepID=A0A7M1T5N1_9FLAO|nr:SCO family protein [Cruoricaptor ignavus]QOR74434.1 SCO family protein [Cruoricaptor ignavus]